MIFGSTICYTGLSRHKRFCIAFEKIVDLLIEIQHSGIGYGDFSPTTPLTKLITIFYGLNGVILLLMLFDGVRQLRGWTIEARSAEKKP
jgi:hypothetical protein